MIGIVPYFLAAGAAALPPRPCTPPTHDELKMIFFEPGSAAIDEKASEVLEESARIAIEENYRGEIVTGYCDADEALAGACPQLALRRSKAVKAALVRMGLKAKWIETRTGTDPLNPEDQPENRRVTVDPKLPPDDCAGR
jgi:outer membrane protein OmpA-like peptidoglycan-associated protein